MKDWLPLVSVVLVQGALLLVFLLKLRADDRRRCGGGGGGGGGGWTCTWSSGSAYVRMVSGARGLVLAAQPRR